MSANRKIAKYAVEKVDGQVERESVRFDRNSGGIKPGVVKQDAGYMVYLPNGNSIRVKNERELKRLGFNVPAPIIDEALDGAAIPGQVATDEDLESMKKTVEKNTRSKAEINRNAK